MENNEKIDQKNMTREEFEVYLREKALENTASVGDFVEYLRKNFDLEDKICYIDCVEGYKYDLTPIKKSDLGETKFKYIKDEKERLRKIGDSEEMIASFYEYVGDDYVLVY